MSSIKGAPCSCPLPNALETEVFTSAAPCVVVEWRLSGCSGLLENRTGVDGVFDRVEAILANNSKCQAVGEFG